jgi:Transcriptional activator of glycolytic enzymes
MLTSISALQLEPLSASSFPLALQPSAAESEARSALSPLAYTFIKAQTVADVWREYKEGIAGGPAVEELERLWQARWRPSQAQRITWCRRKIIINEILRLVQAGSAPADAVAQLEARRGSSGLRSLQTLIQAQKGSQRA